MVNLLIAYKADVEACGRVSVDVDVTVYRQPYICFASPLTNVSLVLMVERVNCFAQRLLVQTCRNHKYSVRTRR